MADQQAHAAVRKSVRVRCDVATAFRIWTEQIDLWWPKGHSRSGDPNTTVLLEPRRGGRLYERTSDGVEHAWGEIIAWSPPDYFAYTWYLGSGPTQPTRVDIHFVATPEGARVDVVHRGPDLIGALWSQNAARYDAAWVAVLPHYAAACRT